MASGDLLLRAHAGAPVLARAFSCRLLVPARRRSGLISPLAASKVGIADVVGRVRSGGADQKRRRRDAKEGFGFSGVATRRELIDDEKVEQDEEDEVLKLGVEKNGGETGGVDGSYLSETR
jgi:ATP-dependent RNA helicase MSS116, mitochondrial